MTDELDHESLVREGLLKLQQVKEVTLMPGWGVITDHFLSVIAAVTDQLCIEEDINKIKRFQERRRAFQSMLETVKALCDSHSEQLQLLEDIVADNKERDQYGFN